LLILKGVIKNSDLGNNNAGFLHDLFNISMENAIANIEWIFFTKLYLSEVNKG